MIIETLLREALATSLGLLSEAGFKDEVGGLPERLTQDADAAYHESFDQAWGTARARLDEGILTPLLSHPPFQEAVVAALLDPEQSFDVSSAAEALGERYAGAVRPLRRFFATLAGELEDDAHWGALLEQYQKLSLRDETKQALQAGKLDVPTPDLIRRVRALLAGSGAIAQEHGVAAGAHGVAVGRDVHQIVLRQIIMQGSAPSTSLRQRYLARLLNQCYALPLAALGGEAGPNKSVTLDQVYIELDTTVEVQPSTLAAIRRGERVDLSQVRARQEPERHDMGRRLSSPDLGGQDDDDEPQPLAALDAFRLTPHMVLLGDPGAGKSTFVRIVIAQLAAGQSPAGLSADLLPIFVTLRDVVPSLADLDLDAIPDAEHDAALAKAMRDHMLAALKSLDAGGFENELLNVLNDHTCFLVFDGLDEVPQELRGRVRQAVLAVLERYQPPYVMITCRVRSYVGKAVLPGVETWTLDDFKNHQIAGFARAWYRAHAELGRLGAGQAEQRAESLVQSALGDALRDLAANPMLLTTMALIHYQDVGLPEEAVRLYTRAVEILLYRWQQQKVGQEALDALLGNDRRLRPLMERLAYEAHRSKADAESGDTADVSRHQAQDLLEDELGDVQQARDFLDYVDQRAGLLLGRGEAHGRPASYGFPHRTFQEYLAGCYLLGGNDSDRVTAFYACAGEGDGWNLVAQYGFEELYHNTRNGEEQLLHLAYNLLGDKLDSEQAQRAALWSARMADLVGRDAIERDTRHPMGGSGYLGRLLPRCVTLLGGVLSAPERAQAGEALAALGDPRFNPAAWYLPDDGMLGFVEIPEGVFTMGSDDPIDVIARSERYKPSPVHSLMLPAYYMSRYPVTVAQFRVFVQASGHQPSDPDCLEGVPNHLVVYVSWQDAVVYCDWLTAQLCSHLDALPESLAEWLRDSKARIMLPSEAEWEKAARGPRSFIYPWGNEVDSNRANYADTGVNTRSTVGCFPGGASVPYGVEDLSGNVWE